MKINLRPSDKITGPLKNQKGMAMLVSLFALALLVFIATEVGYETQVEYISSSQEVNRLKAYYAAKAGVEISLLRVLIYKKALAGIGANLPSDQKSMLDPIWNFPYAWPPVVPDELTGAEKDEINKSVKESSMNGQILSTIQSEGGKIDINDLGSPSKALREGTKNQILKIFLNKVETDDDFREKHGSVNFEELVNHLVDWVDEDTESLNGGEESSYYSEELTHDMIPPNSAFKTLKEIHMVKDMTDEFYNLLKDKVTIYGSKGINVNYSTAEVLTSLDPQITKEYAAKIIARRTNKEQGGPFKSEDEFIDYLGSGEINIDTNDFNKDGIPLLFEEEHNFRIKSTGNFANATREISVIVYDTDNLKERLIKLLDKDDNEAKGQDDDGSQAPSAGTDPNKPKTDPAKEQKPKIKPPKGRPTIVYWEEI